MIRTRKAQTATEYIILLGITLIIVGIGVGIVQFAPAIGLGAQSRASAINLASYPVAIEQYAVTPSATIIQVKNTLKGPATITAITVDGSSFSGSLFPVYLQPGQSTVIESSTSPRETSTAYRHEIAIWYVDEMTGTQYTQEGTIVEGIVGK